MSFKKIFLLAATCLSFSSCKQVLIQDGKIPDQYVALAKNYMLKFDGSFEGNQGSLELHLDKDKKVSVIFDAKVNDILGDENCKSQIGDLREIQISDDETQIESASFDFSPGNCRTIAGTSLDLNFNVKDNLIRMAASILKEIDQKQVCDLAASKTDPSSAPHCHSEYDSYYLGGIYQASMKQLKRTN